MSNELNALDQKNKKLLAVVDGSYINKFTFNHNIEGVNLVGRARKNSRFFFKAQTVKGKQFSSKESFTAEEFRQDKSKKFKVAEVHYAGAWRKIRYKEIKEVYQKHSTKRKSLRLIAYAPTPYRRNKQGKLSTSNHARHVVDVQ